MTTIAEAYNYLIIVVINGYILNTSSSIIIQMCSLVFGIQLLIYGFYRLLKCNKI